MSGVSGDVLATHPGFRQFRQVIPLAGFSGAAIALLRDGGGAQFVRKAATTPDLNGAMRMQADRQQWLRDRLAGMAHVPDILCQGEIDGLYYFDMEFVPSRDANAYLATASFKDVERFASSIEQLIGHLSQSRLEGRQAHLTQSVITKLVDIDARTSGAFADLLEPLHRLVASSGGLVEPAPATLSHGDLTFENILVGANNELWLIDPITSPADHYWFDLSKLFQECEGHWYLHRRKPLSTGVVHWLRNRWFRAARDLAPDYAAWHYFMLALTFARILPYARTDEDVGLIVRRVQQFSSSAAQVL